MDQTDSELQGGDPVSDALLFWTHCGWRLKTINNYYFLMHCGRRLKAIHN